MPKNVRQVNYFNRSLPCFLGCSDNLCRKIFSPLCIGENTVLLAAVLCANLAGGKNNRELEMLINLLNLMQNLLAGILTQREIIEKQGAILPREEETEFFF